MSLEYCMREMTCEYFNDRFSILNDTDWLVLVVVMLMHYPPT